MFFKKNYIFILFFSLFFLIEYIYYTTLIITKYKIYYFSYFLFFLDMEDSNNKSDNLFNDNLIEAVRKGSLEDVISIYNKFPENINNINESGRSALMWAVHENDIDKVKFLLDCKEIDINLTNRHGESALHYSSYSYVSIDIFKMFLKVDGINLELKNKYNETPLMYSYYYCQYEKMKILIKYGCSIEGWENWYIDKNKSGEYIEKVKDIMNNYKIYLPLWNIRNHYLYPKEWNIKCVNYLLLFKKINNNNNINIPKDIKYMLIEYIYEIWKYN